MKSYKDFFGVLTVIFLSFGLLGVATVGSWQSFVPLVNLGLAALCLILWFFGRTSLEEEASSSRVYPTSVRSSLPILVVLVLLIATNWYAVQFDRRIDLTERAAFSLAAASINAVQSLDKPTTISVVSLPGKVEVHRISELLQLYEQANPTLVSTEIIDPIRSPRRVKELELKRGEVLKLSYGEAEDPRTVQSQQVSEEEVTNGMLRLLRARSPKIYFLSGHGEPSLQNTSLDGFSKFSLALTEANFKTKELLLAGPSSVPEDASMLVVSAASTDLPIEEQDKIVDYAKAGGNVLLLYDGDRSEPLGTLAAKFGFKFKQETNSGDNETSLHGPVGQVLAREFGEHSSVNFAQGSSDLVVFQSLSEPITINAENPIRNYSTLIAGAATAMEQVVADDNRRARVIVVGDLDWLLNGNVDWYSNLDFAIAFTDWLSESSEWLNIPVRSMRPSVAPIPKGSFLFIITLSFLVPELICILGLCVWWRRRMRTALAA